MKYYFLFFFSIGLLYLGCAVRQAPQQAVAPPKIYPEEQNFLRTMNIGDTVFIFIKESGYFQPNDNPYRASHLTYYSRHDICRVDSFVYKTRKYVSIPGGEGHSGPNFEFDTVKFQLQKVLEACTSLEPFCSQKRYQEHYFASDTCLWREPYWKDKLYWLRYTEMGMCDSIYNKWRFTPPSHSQLKNWRETMRTEEPLRIRRYEILSFYNDTCKISYSDEIPIQYPHN